MIPVGPPYGAQNFYCSAKTRDFKFKDNGRSGPHPVIADKFGTPAADIQNRIIIAVKTPLSENLFYLLVTQDGAGDTES